MSKRHSLRYLHPIRYGNDKTEAEDFVGAKSSVKSERSYGLRDHQTKLSKGGCLSIKHGVSAVLRQDGLPLSVSLPLSVPRHRE